MSNYIKNKNKKRLVATGIAAGIGVITTIGGTGLSDDIYNVLNNNSNLNLVVSAYKSNDIKTGEIEQSIVEQLKLDEMESSRSAEKNMQLGRQAIAEVKIEETMGINGIEDMQRKDAEKQKRIEIKRKKARQKRLEAKRREKMLRERENTGVNDSGNKAVNTSTGINGRKFDLPSGMGMFKSYMDYRKVSSVTSDQYKLLRSDNAYTNKYGIRCIDGRCCIAVGSGFTSQIGIKIDVILDNGTVIPCVLGDQKSDTDTDSSHTYHLVDKSVIEFVVDYSTFLDVKDASGTCNFIPGYDGYVESIIVYDDKVDF